MASELSYFSEHLIVGLAGTSLLSREKELLKSLKPLGIILFAKNFDRESADWTSRLADLLKEVQDLIERPDLIISVDHEGGRVHRFPAPVTRFPAAKNWQEDARSVAEAMALELASLGMNLSYAPVLDVHSEPTNPVIGERALAEDPVTVGALGVEVLHGLAAKGIIGCGKHFPGHGATTQDSHHVLPRLDVPRDVLFQRELIPFQAAMRAEVPLLMTAHVVYPVLDPNLPATLSRKIAHDLLRQDLGYHGPLITDDLEMKALDIYSPAEKAVAALQAGVDILLEANPAREPALQIGEKMLIGIANAAEKGSLVLEDSRKRIGTLRAKIKESAAQRDSVKGHLSFVGTEAHRALAEKMGRVG